MNSSTPLVSILIPTYKAADYLLCCVRSLVRSAARSDFEICIYGDGGGDASHAAMLKSKQICEDAGIACSIFYNPKNLGNTSAVNGARKLAKGNWLLLVNDDMVFPANWYALVAADLNEKTVVSISCIEPNVGGHKPAKCFVGQNLGLDPLVFDFEILDKQNEQLFENVLEQGVNYPFLVETSEFDAVGAIDERFFGPYHDPDLFLRFRNKNLKMVRTKKCWLYHFSGISQRFLDNPTPTKNRKQKSAFWRQHENTARLQFIRKWGAKPKAKFGEIPKTSALEPWENKSHTVFETMRYVILLAWENARVLWQKLVRL